MSTKPSTPLLVGIIVILVAILGFFFYRNFQQPQAELKPGISGTFNINGPIPSGATVSLSQKESHTKASMQEFVSGVAATDGGQWTFPEAVSGKSYEITATLTDNGKTVTTADPIFVTAPATDESLVFTITSKTPSGPAAISGTVDLNGYIPQGATISIEGKTSLADYTVFASGIQASQNAPFNYKDALSGGEYTIRASLYDGSGNNIGTSAELTLTAPAKDEALSINSSAKPPVTPTPLPNTPTPVPTPVAISGTINFNGAAQQNTRIVVFERVTGSGNNFQVAQNNISPQNGVTWQWNSATTGTMYDLLAVYKLHNANGTDTDLSTSSIITVAAPATNEVFTLNSGYSVPQNNGQISSSCGSYNSGSNNWSATVTFSAIPNAQSYWIQIGTSNGGNQLTNFTANANNQNALVYNYTLSNNTTYYARYAYAFTPNLQANSNDFSPFSNTTSITCSQ